MFLASALDRNKASLTQERNTLQLLTSIRLRVTFFAVKICLFFFSMTLNTLQCSLPAGQRYSVSLMLIRGSSLPSMSSLILSLLPDTLISRKWSNILKYWLKIFKFWATLFGVKFLILLYRLLCLYRVLQLQSSSNLVIFFWLASRARSFFWKWSRLMLSSCIGASRLAFVGQFLIFGVFWEVALGGCLLGRVFGWDIFCFFIGFLDLG